MSIFGRRLDPDLVRAFKTPQPMYSYTPPTVEPSAKYLDKARSRAWDLAAQYAYTSGLVDMKGYDDILNGNPFREEEP